MPCIALKYKAAVPLLNVYIKATAMQRVTTVYNHLVEKEIRQTFKYIKGVRATQRGNTPKLTSQETLRLQAAEREQEIQELLQH